MDPESMKNEEILERQNKESKQELTLIFVFLL